jgi:hypothetical protein
MRPLSRTLLMADLKASAALETGWGALVADGNVGATKV